MHIHLHALSRCRGSTAARAHMAVQVADSVETERVESSDFKICFLRGGKRSPAKSANARPCLIHFRTPPLLYPVSEGYLILFLVGLERKCDVPVNFIFFFRMIFRENK